MKEIIKRLNEIDSILASYEGKVGETYTVLNNRRRSERNGIVFALKCLGLAAIHGINGWYVEVDSTDEEG